MANLKEERKRRSHEAILASAATLLRERGIQGSSVGEVMKGAGLTVGGFYGHFESKEEMFAEAIRGEASSHWDRLFELARGETPRERALDLLRKYLSRPHRDRPGEGCLLPGTAAEIAREGEPYRSALAERLEGFGRSLADLLEEEGGEGRRERREEALGLIALMSGALSLSRAVAGTPLSDELLRAARKLGERLLAEE